MKKNRAGKLIGIFLVMLKIGLFTFGGGYAMIALLENEFVTKKKWIGKDEFLDMIAIRGIHTGTRCGKQRNVSRIQGRRLSRSLSRNARRLHSFIYHYICDITLF